MRLGRILSSIRNFGVVCSFSKNPLIIGVCKDGNLFRILSLLRINLILKQQLGGAKAVPHVSRLSRWPDRLCLQQIQPVIEWRHRKRRWNWRILSHCWTTLWQKYFRKCLYIFVILSSRFLLLSPVRLNERADVGIYRVFNVSNVSPGFLCMHTFSITRSTCLKYM